MLDSISQSALRSGNKLSAAGPSRWKEADRKMGRYAYSRAAPDAGEGLDLICRSPY